MWVTVSDRSRRYEKLIFIYLHSFQRGFLRPGMLIIIGNKLYLLLVSRDAQSYKTSKAMMFV